MSSSVDHVVTSGTFSLDGGTWDVDNNVWLVGDEHEVIVVDAAHDLEKIASAVAGRRVVAVRHDHRHDIAPGDGIDYLARAVRGVDDDDLIVIADHPHVVVDVPGATV